MSQPVDDPRRALYDAYLEVPEHKCAEILDGTLYVLPRPSPPHANAASVLGGDLNGAFQRGRGGPGGWWILDEPELHLVELEPMSPDIAGWRVERMPALPETAHFTVVPDWVCEILSKSTENIDRNKKLPIYATCGVKHAWLVDPIAKTLEVHILGEGGRWRECAFIVRARWCGRPPSRPSRSSSMRCGARPIADADSLGASAPRATLGRMSGGAWSARRVPRLSPSDETPA
jgi:Uma2 family endonuclease